MPHLSTSLIPSLLIAMLTVGCASQNAMSLLPDSVKLDVARDKAAKEGPLSVDEMMAKAKKLHPAAETDKQVATSIDSTKTASLPNPAAQLDEPIQTAYAEESSPRLQKEGVGNENAGSPAELFQQAMLLNQQAQTFDQTPSVDDIKAAAAAHEWRRLLDEQEAERQAEDRSVAMPISTEIPLVMPIYQVEIIPVNFNAAHDGLAKDDDLKIKLLRFGKRVPQQITIGKIKDAQGFQVMQSALALGKIIAAASGGAPAITYDPALPTGAAEVRYASTGRQS